MMKNFFLTLIALLVIGSVTAQDLTKSLTKNSVGAKLLGINYAIPNSIEGDTLGWTNGLEAVYLRHINKYVNIGIPFKAGVIQAFGDRNNRTFISLDAIVQGQFGGIDKKVIPYAFGGGGIVFENINEESQNIIQFPVGAGLNIRLGKSAFFNLQGEYRVSPEENRNNIQAGAGLLYRIGKKGIDSDEDGIIDELDKCPKVPGLEEFDGCPDRDGDKIIDGMDECPDEPGLKKFNGCPDSDDDGIMDKKDECPDIPGTAEAGGCPDADGDGIKDSEDDCPNEPGSLTTKGCPDSDGDGVLDKDDRCPNEAGLADLNGCPLRDSDNDGIPDGEDECPDVAGLAAMAGCPDTDGDGIADHIDKCPSSAGNANNMGCPEVSVEDRDILMFAMQNILFDTNKASLKSESYSILDQVVDIMNRYPEHSLAINGHTDNTGKASYNQKLSERRAKTCYDYLVSNGISASRLSYAGYGSDRPIAENDTAEGRSLNRRVEFDLHIK